MQYEEGRVGRVFVLRLEDGETLPKVVEDFAAEKNIRGAACWLIGGLGPGTVVAGPKDKDAVPLEVIQESFDEPREVLAVGTLFADESGVPRLHMHAATGRGRETLTGCIRPGVDTWLIGEFLIMEITGTAMLRKVQPDTGLALLSKP